MGTLAKSKVEIKHSPVVTELHSREYEIIAFLTSGQEELERENYKAAFDIYTTGIDHTRSLGFDEDFHVNEANPIILDSVPSLYVARAGAGLKLKLWEQVISDCNRAIHMMVCPGVTKPGRGCVASYKNTYALALLRRGEAMKQVGLLVSAQYSLAMGGRSAEDDEALTEATQLGIAHGHPIPWGRGLLEEVPPPRSSISNYVSGDLIAQAQLPATVAGMSATVYRNKIFLFGGRNPAKPTIADSSLRCFDPATGKITRLNVVGDPNAPDREHREPLPRSHHVSVIFKDKLFVWGGEITEWRQRRVLDEQRTLWYVDLSLPVLQWQRIVIPTKAANPQLRKSCAYAMYNDNLIVFGGAATVGGEEKGDLWMFNFPEKKWTDLQIEHRPRAGKKPLGPEKRQQCVGWVFDDQFFVFGGLGHDAKNLKDPGFFFNDTWKFDLLQDAKTAGWTSVLCSGPVPAGRADMGIATTPEGVVYMVGGMSAPVPTSAGNTPPSLTGEIHEFSSNTGHWRQLRVAGMQNPLGAPRTGVAAAEFEGLIYYLGGEGEGHKGIEEVGKLKLKLCALCTKTKQDTGHLYQCSGCKELHKGPTFYCSLECQQEDWVAHSYVCAEGRVKK